MSESQNQKIEMVRIIHAISAARDDLTGAVQLLNREDVRDSTIALSMLARTTQRIGDVMTALEPYTDKGL